MPEMGSKTAGLGFNRKQCNIRLVFCGNRIRLQGLHPLIGRTDQIISRRIHGTTWMQLVADGTMRPHGDHLATFKDQRIRSLEAAKFSPVRMEPAGHAKHRQSKPVRVASGCGKVVVTPAPCRQTFQFELAIEPVALLLAFEDVARVVEDPHIRKRAVYLAAEALEKRHQHGFVICLPVSANKWVELPFTHGVQATRAHTIIRSENIHEECRRRVGLADLSRHGEEIVHIVWVIEAQCVPGRRQLVHGAGFGPGVVCSPVFSLHHPPFRMFACTQLIPLHGHVYRGLDIGFPARPHHVAKQIGTGQIRMRFAHLRGIVGPAMVATAEKRHRGDLPILENLYKLLGIEVGTDTLDMFGGMKIQMHLTEAKVFRHMFRHAFYPFAPLRFLPSAEKYF